MTIGRRAARRRGLEAELEFGVRFAPEEGEVEVVGVIGQLDPLGAGSEAAGHERPRTTAERPR